MTLTTGSGSQSAQTWTGVGPKHAFFLTGVSSPDVTNIIGVDVTATRSAGGKYVITHNLGKTNYCAIFQVEDDTATGGGNVITARIYDRSANSVTVWCEDDGGALSNVDVLHGVIYD